MPQIYTRLFVLFMASILLVTHGIAQCDEDYDWAVWDDFLGNSATGTITQNGQTIAVKMVANYDFDSTPSIYNFPAFNGFDGVIANHTVPRTNWAAGTGGETMMCFSEVVTNPILLLSSIGRPNLAVTLELSLPFISIYDGGGMTFVDNQTIIGNEGYTVLLFPGEFECITIFSSTPEFYTNINWGLNPPLFEVEIEGDLIFCESTTLTASGGSAYQWSGGDTPNSASNTFTETGTYFLTVTDDFGCTVTTSVFLQVDLSCLDCKGIPNGTAILDDCGVCLEPSDPTFNQSCIDCNGVPNGTAVFDGCDVCLEPNDPTFNQSCAGENVVYIPNVFSPNRDGLNDDFQVLKKSDTEIQLRTYRIFDRWGALVYELGEQNLNTSVAWWDGTYQGKDMQNGTYVYYVELGFRNGEVKEYKGDVTILR